MKFTLLFSWNLTQLNFGVLIILIFIPQLLKELLLKILIIKLLPFIERYLILICFLLAWRRLHYHQMFEILSNELEEVKIYHEFYWIAYNFLFFQSIQSFFSNCQRIGTILSTIFCKSLSRTVKVHTSKSQLNIFGTLSKIIYFSNNFW